MRFQTPFTDEELPPKKEYPVLAKICIPFFVLGVAGLAYLGENSLDEEKGMARLQSAAERGDPEAQYNLALCYENGHGVNEGMEKAVEWLIKAAEQGYFEAQAELGACYLTGNGVPEHKDEGLRWIRQAAEQGYPTAKQILEQLTQE